MRIIGNSLHVIAALLIIYLRIKYIHLTEGELLLYHLPEWILAIGLVIGGAFIKYNPSSEINGYPGR